MSDSVKKYYELVEDGSIDSNDKLDKKRPYIYESPDKGITVYRREFNTLEERELVFNKSLKTVNKDLLEIVIRLAREHKDLSPKLIISIAEDELSVKKVCDWTLSS